MPSKPDARRCLRDPTRTDAIKEHLIVTDGVTSAVKSKFYYPSNIIYCKRSPVKIGDLLTFMKIIPIAVPTPFYVGDVNVYLIKEEPLTLIDVGPKTSEAAAALREKLKRNGVEFSDIERIVLTHAHEDHCGLAKQVRDEAKNAEILVHRWETGHLFGRLAREEHRKLMFRAGVPDAVFEEMQSIYAEISLLTDALGDGDVSELKDEQDIEFAADFEGSAHARTYARLVQFCPRSKSNDHCRRLRSETHHAESDRFARPVRRRKAFQIFSGISCKFSENPQLFADIGLRRTRRTDRGF